MSKKTLLLLAGAAAVYYFMRKPAPHPVVRQGIPAPLPTDSMAGGTMPAAVQGMITDYPRQAQIAAMTGY
jgi:hypothetical protein